MYTKINESIHKVTPPYKDIYTTVCAISTPSGVMLFDAASFEGDIETYVLPMLSALGIEKEAVKYVFISHEHTDHAGALGELLRYFPEVTVLSRSPSLEKKHPGCKVLCPEDGERFLEVLQVVTIPGHTLDSMALLDTRTNTLLTGDCLQVYGIFGAQAWGANIGFPAAYLAALEKVRALPIAAIYTAHDYHPCGVQACGAAEITRMLDGCIAPLEKIKQLICAQSEKTDADIVELYNSDKTVPRVGERVVSAVRDAVMQGKM